MKYMGSKRYMLQNGLGDWIKDLAGSAHRVVDLFCGSGAVSWFAAEHTSCPVLAIDLQHYAVALARAVVGRTCVVDPVEAADGWMEPAYSALTQSALWSKAIRFEKSSDFLHGEDVQSARQLCETPSAAGPVWNAYGGFYFSPSQALSFDYLLKYLPETEPMRSLCLAAIISAASKCAAAPGHTAQPFQPTQSAAKFVQEAWLRNPFDYCRKALNELAQRRANTLGDAQVGNAIEVASWLNSTDLVIVDPPYSNVQYSRFYHVLETMARGYCGTVEGSGRYPPVAERPQSPFSLRSQSEAALTLLLERLAQARCSVILTFPSLMASNGLSASSITTIASSWFNVFSSDVNSSGKLSTLGGNHTHRPPRQASSESILIMYPLDDVVGAAEND